MEREVVRRGAGKALATGIHVGEDDKPGILGISKSRNLCGQNLFPNGDRVQQRGWEWLVSEIDTVGKP